MPTSVTSRIERIAEGRSPAAGAPAGFAGLTNQTPFDLVYETPPVVIDSLVWGAPGIATLIDWRLSGPRNADVPLIGNDAESTVS